MTHDTISGTIVVKYGGHAMDAADLQESFAMDIASLSKKGMQFAIVHGGGPQINDLLTRLDIKSFFVDGLRVTDAQTLAGVEMALCGKVNKAITRYLLKYGVLAAGISGQDGNMLEAMQKNPELGHVGVITKVNPGILTCLFHGHFTPVIAPLALDDDFNPLNVNADTAAGAIAGALEADYFVLVSDVPGVLDAQNELIARLTGPEIQKLKEEGIISGGMIPKVDCCLHALEAGCKRALILNGRQKNSLKKYIEQGSASGTLITMS